MKAEVWILDNEQVVLCQISGIGVPDAVVIASDGTIGGTRFMPESLLGPFPLPKHGCGWGEAGRIAEREAMMRGYRVVYYDPMIDVEGEEP